MLLLAMYMSQMKAVGNCWHYTSCIVAVLQSTSTIVQHSYAFIVVYIMLVADYGFGLLTGDPTVVACQVCETGWDWP